MPYNFLVLADENNENIVLDIVERLEKEKVHGQGVKGYWMSRDALPVMPVFDSIIDSIRKSQFILILLDPGNISVWMKRQIDLSLKIVLQSRMDSIIPIYLRDPANPQEKDNIPMGLQILKGLKYIKNDLDNEALFWKELGKAVIGREI